MHVKNKNKTQAVSLNSPTTSASLILSPDKVTKVPQEQVALFERQIKQHPDLEIVESMSEVCAPELKEEKKAAEKVAADDKDDAKKAK